MDATETPSTPLLPPPLQQHWLSIAQACVHAQVTRRTIYNWLNAGKLRFVRTAGGRVRIDPTSLYRSDVRG